MYRSPRSNRTISVKLEAVKMWETGKATHKLKQRNVKFMSNEHRPHQHCALQTKQFMRQQVTTLQALCYSYILGRKRAKIIWQIKPFISLRLTQSLLQSEQYFDIRRLKGDIISTWSFVIISRVWVFLCGPRHLTTGLQSTSKRSFILRRRSRMVSV